MTKSETLFHYTDVSALSSILRNKVLWLTNLGYLNDSQEFHDGVAVVSRVIECLVAREGRGFEQRGGGLAFAQGVLQCYKDLGVWSSLYSCSFSGAGNLLSQWRAYGNYAIEFCREGLESALSLHDCVYDAAAKESLAERVLKPFIEEAEDYMKTDFAEDMPGLACLTEKISTFKNEHFAAEHEVRIIGKSDYHMSGVKFRPRGDLLIPYQEISFPVESIVAIHIGPIANQDLAENSLSMLLRTCGLTRVRIVKSDIPFRA
ncbi:DUF2971 domain-containing protein [Pseudomonas sp. NBRC 111130]|uniref:DUF2971 domain-containing protein n=1 Tax=Pseudomonas sp. NBRC 111130 TaxID=1661045 RepID=UPI000AF2E9E4|nr:DUF2971 domain-containing protein [Pseudomonas sp. NBRC 111130]